WGADALLTSTVTPPNVASANEIRSRTSESFRTSARKKAARPPPCSIKRTVSWPPDSLMSETTTAEPRVAKRTAIARPQPVPPALVTIVTSPEIFILRLRYFLVRIRRYDLTFSQD